jgi:hypothetical protein
MEKDGRGKRPEQEYTPLKEQGGGQRESEERQPLPNVWEILERSVRLGARGVKGQIIGHEEYDRECREVLWLESELWKKGTARDKLIIDLFTGITIQPRNSLPLPFEIRELSLKEFRQFRSEVEPMSDEEIAEEIRKQEAENERKAEEIFKRRRPGLPSLAKY